MKRFLEKVYNQSDLDNIRFEVSNVNRNELVNRYKEKRNKFEMAFVTGFNLDYIKVEKSLKKFCPILMKDTTLNKILSRKPSFIYRKALGLRNMIAKNVVDPPKKRNRTFLDTIGFYRCGRCKSCRTTADTRIKLRCLEEPIGKNITFRNLCHATQGMWYISSLAHVG